LFAGNEIFLQISADFFNILTYIATALVSSIFTKFIEKKTTPPRSGATGG
jgi:hypothetical protein